MNKTAVILINVGTPDKPTVKHVRKFLFQFLNDRRVIDLPWLLQKLLVNLIIVPFRAPKSTRLYKRLWTSSGSPLIIYSEQTKDKLQKIVPDSCTVFNAMRYGNPGYEVVLNKVKDMGFGRIILIPMFPQYASSTTGTAIQAIMKEIKKWNNIPEIHTLNQFYREPGFLNAFVNRAKECHFEKFDHIIFSYHGLPLRQIDKCHPTVRSIDCTCTKAMPVHGEFCYKASCYETSRLLAKKLGLSPEEYTISFQSRLSNNWLEPFTDETIKNEAQQGVKKLLIMAPAFVADCLETLDEIGREYSSLFLENGGEELKLVPSLNDMDEWVETLNLMIQKNL